MSYLKNEKKAVEEAARQLTNYRTRWVAEVDNREDIEEQVRIFSSMLPPGVREKAITKATMYTPQSVYDSVSDQIEKDRLLKEEGNN
jgi:hypothetical protein